MPPKAVADFTIKDISGICSGMRETMGHTHVCTETPHHGGDCLCAICDCTFKKEEL